MVEIVKLTEYGLYCEEGDFFIDPWRPVGRAVITHAHADHARFGNVQYLAARPGERILRARIGDEAKIQTLNFGEELRVNSVNVSLHPAGHVLGSSQIRIEHKGEVWVISGDYKVEADRTCEGLSPVKCNTFITESTFGLPIYRWRPQLYVFDEINRWWQKNKESGKASLLFAYALGKAQRLLSGVDASIGPIFGHGAVYKLTEEYRASGVSLPPMQYVGDMPRNTKYGGSLILAPPSAMATPWTRQFGPVSTAFASGWVRIRGTRRRRSIDRGFVLSDHADWPGLNEVILATEAERVVVTHGYASELVRWLHEHGIKAQTMQTEFAGELDDAPDSEKHSNANDVLATITQPAEDVDLNAAAWTVKERQQDNQSIEALPFGNSAPFIEDGR